MLFYQDIQDILNLSQNGHYQIACTKYFEAKHGASPSATVINHPNQFFEESQKVKDHCIIDNSSSNSCKLTSIYYINLYLAYFYIMIMFTAQVNTSINVNVNNTSIKDDINNSDFDQSIIDGFVDNMDCD